MGYCTNCGQPTDRPDNICPYCAGESVQQSPFQQQQTGGDNFSVSGVKESRTYWEVIFGDPTIAFNQLFKGGTPENNFDISEYENKFNWGAFLGFLTWLAFNCNFWIALIIGVALGSIPFIGWIAAIALWVYLGFNGNKITYKTRPYGDLENFKKNQKIWSWASLALFAVSLLPLLCFFGAMFLGIIGSILH